MSTKIRGKRKLSYPKGYKKRKSKRSYVSSISQGVPDMMTAILPYAEIIDMSGGVSTCIQQVFRLNSVYDPNYTGTGHQPLCYDDWATFYNRYEVISCSYDLRFCVSTTAGSNLLITVVPTQSSTVLSNNESIPEQMHSKHLVLGATGNQALGRVKGSFNIRKLSRNSDDGNLAAYFTNNPADTWFLQISAQSLDKVAIPDVYVHCLFKYKVKMFDRKEQIQS